MTYTSIRTEQRDGVAVVTLCRPDALNALTDEMKRELADALKSAERDDSARAIVLTGDGRGFCAGEALNPDLVKSAEPPLDRTLRDYYHPVIERMRAMEKPIVAAVNGTCAGAGVSLALAADFRVASEKASFLMAFVKIGLVPDAGSTFFLPRLVGMGKAVEMCMLGDKVDAAEAERLGTRPSHGTRRSPHGGNTGPCGEAGAGADPGDRLDEARLQSQLPRYARGSAVVRGGPAGDRGAHRGLSRGRAGLSRQARRGLPRSVSRSFRGPSQPASLGAVKARARISG